MSQEENNKSLMRRWYDEMWQPCNFDLIPELAGPHYTRHDMMGTRTVTGEEYRDSLKMFGATWTIRDFNYFLMSEGTLSHRLAAGWLKTLMVKGPMRNGSGCSRFELKMDA